MEKERSTELRDMIAELGLVYPPPVHVIRRLAFFLEGGQHVDYLDGVVDTSENIPTGCLIAFSGGLVIQVDWRQGGYDQSLPPSTVEVSAWARSTLTGVELRSDLGKSINSDLDWDSEYFPEWPYRALLTLHYSGRKGQIQLPLSFGQSKEQRVKFRTFAKCLLNELSNSP
jgi:hypothetical protein